MDDDVQVEKELAGPMDPPRLRRTYLSQRPRSQSMLVTILSVVGIGAFTQLAWFDPKGWGQLLYVSKGTLFDENEWWRAITATLIHADMGHFLSNISVLVVFIFFLYGYFGKYLYPFLALAGATLVNILTVMTYPDEVRLLGASGLLYLLGGCWLTLYFFIQRQYGILNRTVRVLGVGALLFFPTQYQPSTSYRAHAIGFAIGVLIGVGYFVWHRQRLRDAEVYMAESV